MRYVLSLCYVNGILAAVDRQTKRYAPVVGWLTADSDGRAESLVQTCVNGGIRTAAGKTNTDRETYSDGLVCGGSDHGSYPSCHNRFFPRTSGDNQCLIQAQYNRLLLIPCSWTTSYV